MGTNVKKDTIIFISLDTHKKFHHAAYVEDGRGKEVVDYGQIKGSKTALTQFLKKMQSKYPNAILHVVYEAGPCGFWIYRHITSLGHRCHVVSPSKIPKAPGERVKTDRRDAIKLAKLLKSEDLTPIYVPEEEDEVVRDLSRLREVAMQDLNDARKQLKSFLLRNNIVYEGTANWSAKHLQHLADLTLPHPTQQIVLREYMDVISERTQRLERMDNELNITVKQWRFYPVVKGLQAMRGVRLIIATGVVAELGDLKRFDHPRKLMAYLGLVPSEHSSGGKRRVGSITKAGNKRVRRLLTEGAHSYRSPANISREIQVRLEGLPKDVTDIAWKAQLRLCQRYRRLYAKGKHRNLVVSAIAREMASYLWAIAQQVDLPPVDPKNNLARVPAYQ